MLRKRSLGPEKLYIGIQGSIVGILIAPIRRSLQVGFMNVESQRKHYITPWGTPRLTFDEIYLLESFCANGSLSHKRY